MWIMVLLAIHAKNPDDIPARVYLDFPTEEACRASARSLTYWLKFDSFKITAHCERKR
jgi:hypothetical protein